MTVLWPSRWMRRQRSRPPFVLIRTNGLLQVRTELTVNRAAREVRPIEENLRTHHSRPRAPWQSGLDLIGAPASRVCCPAACASAPSKTPAVNSGATSCFRLCTPHAEVESENDDYVRYNRLLSVDGKSCLHVGVGHERLRHAELQCPRPHPVLRAQADGFI